MLFAPFTPVLCTYVYVMPCVYPVSIVISFVHRMCNVYIHIYSQPANQYICQLPISVAASVITHSLLAIGDGSFAVAAYMQSRICMAASFMYGCVLTALSLLACRLPARPNSWRSLVCTQHTRVFQHTGQKGEADVAAVTKWKKIIRWVRRVGDMCE